MRDRLRSFRLPLAPGTLPGVLAASATLACSEFVRSGMYASYLPGAAGALLGLHKQEAVAVAATAFTVHFISDTVMRGPAGALIVKYGARLSLLAGAALSLLALALIMNAHAPWMLLLGAALHGVGFSVMWPATMTTTADAAFGSHQGRALTVVSMGVMPLIGLGFLLMGALADQPRALITALVLAVQGAGLAAAFFAPRERRVSAPTPDTAPRGRLKNAARALAPLLPAALMQTLTMTLLGPLLFTLYKDLGTTYWGMVAVLGVGGALAFAAMPLTGRYADGGNARLAVTIGFALVCLGLAGISSLPPFWALFPLAALVGLGYAFLMPGWSALVVTRLPEAERPAAWGALMTVENLGTSLGPLLGALAYRTLGTPGPFLAGAIMAALTALGYIAFRQVFLAPPRPVGAAAHETPTA